MGLALDLDLARVAVMGLALDLDLAQVAVMVLALDPDRILARVAAVMVQAMDLDRVMGGVAAVMVQAMDPDPVTDRAPYRRNSVESWMKPSGIRTWLESGTWVVEKGPQGPFFNGAPGMARSAETGAVLVTVVVTG
jgi:hypothetical protein